MKRFCSIFSQLLQLFPRLEFEQSVKKHRADRGAKGFTSWGQFVAMVFCQLGRAHTLREICGGLGSCEGKLMHLGVSAVPPENRPVPQKVYRPVMRRQEPAERSRHICGTSLESSMLRQRVLTIEREWLY